MNLFSEDCSIGYILEVNLGYPDELHDFHNDYPLAPKKLKLVMLFCQNIAVTLLKIWNKSWWCYRLFPNLGTKSKHIVHHKNLQLYLSLGMMKLTKTDRGLKFKQSDWLKTYIDFNREKRKNAVYSFLKIFCKLMIGSVNVKTMGI